MNLISRSLVISYLENQIINDQREEERLFHLLQFLSFVKSLKLNRFKDCQKHKIKKQFYYGLKFPLSQFVKFTGMQLSNQSDREKLIFYFSQLQKLDPIVKVFSSRAFLSYLCFPYLGKSFLQVLGYRGIGSQGTFLLSVSISITEVVSSFGIEK